MVDLKPLDFAGFVENFNYYYHVFVANALDFKPLDFAGFVENFNYYYHVFVANALSIGFEALDFVSALSWTWKLISFVIVVLFFKFILNFLIFLLFLPFKIVLNFLHSITKIIKGVANGLITITSQILDWTIWPIQFPVKLAGEIKRYTKVICKVTFRSKSFSDFVNSLILRLKRFGMCRSDKGFYDCLKIVFDICVGFVIGCSTPGVYASAVIYVENVDNQAFASAMKYSALFVGWLYHLVCTHWIISTVLVVFCSVVQYMQDKIGGGGGGGLIKFVQKIPNMRNLSLLIGFYVNSEKLIPHSFGVLNLSLFMGFLANSINILRNISQSFGAGTFIIVAVAAYYYFYGFPNLKFE
jgi:hypothetical protein